MKKRLLSTSISTLLLGLSVMPAFADEDVTAWRLFIADHDKPVVNVIDALDGDKLATFNVKGPAIYLAAKVVPQFSLSRVVLA
ncbi:hypothetical protein ACUM9J_10975 [Klebsiella pneumoniae]